MMTVLSSPSLEQEDSPDLSHLRTRLASARTPLECYRIMIAAGTRAAPGLSFTLFDAYVAIAQQARELAARLHTMGK
jgi:hypothetical protein